MTELIPADKARELVSKAAPNREEAEADTLANAALTWAMKNAEGQTASRIMTYAKYGKTDLTVKFAPGESDHGGEGNAFYNDLLANSNVRVADAITDIIYGREQNVLSPIQEMRLLNFYNARLVKFVKDLKRMGYTVDSGTASSATHGYIHKDDSTILVSWPSE